MTEISNIIGGDNIQHNFIKAYARKESNYIGHGFSYSIAKAQKLIKSKFVLFLTLNDSLNNDFWKVIENLDNEDKTLIGDDDAIIPQGLPINDFILYSSKCKNRSSVKFEDLIIKEKGNNFPFDCSQAVLYNVNFLVTKLKYYFEDYYDVFMNHMFLLNCLQNGANGEFIQKDILTSENNKQLTVYGQKEIIKHIHKLYYTDTFADKPQLTAIIAFRNEKSEIERTVKSIRFTTKNVDILLVDDCSDDNYDYKSIADLYKCKYIRNEKRLGSAGSKNKGGYLCQTPNFCFFDGHMRLYHQDWDEMCIKLLDEHPKAIISSRTVYMSLTDAKHDIVPLVRNEYVEGKNAEGVSYCSYIRMDSGFAFDPKWTDKLIDKDADHQLSPVSCVLGACYAIKTDWWKTIKGFEEIQQYGLEESLMSIKSWLYGGECYLVKNWGVGHIYRSKNPNPVSGNDIDANRLSLINFFYYNDEENRIKYTKELKDRIGENSFKKVVELYNKVRDKVENNAEEFWTKAPRNLKWFFTNINNKVCSDECKLFIDEKEEKEKEV